MTYEAQNLHDQPGSDYSSYGFNGGNYGGTSNSPPAYLNETTFPGVFGLRQASIKAPAKTVLLMAIPGFFPWSWHQPQKLPPGKYGLNDAKDLVGFVDGHTDYVKVYWNSNYNITSCCYDPPSGYDYKRSGN